ncbi:MAG TPA: glycoside-pentoside-hexuronide (GPH):cation symporter [Anaerolineae bacterium]|nr:glycoside-pentoside-hexuronide (GPH):cation symporter [Anaerolineae bacterium]HOQ97348.1 glycoside-pentoside-hexuronide (GPH):cation symporter [Anaerolineae bacterium]HPL27312.1 glycoside-pentoside-hexuronide (GPH):cation symporter [Anaerolineae bacterium]
MTLSPSEKLSWWRKIGYGLGDIYGGGSGVIISFYYLYFLTDVVRLSPGLAGTVILISKVYDAITDPFEGVLADRTRTVLGRRRPYLLLGIPFVFLSFFALFFPFNAPAEAQRFALVIGSYLFFSTVVSIVTLNYSALQAELTLDYHERTTLSSVRIFFSTLSSILCALLPLEIVKQFADMRQGYIVMGLAFGAFFALPFIATVITTRERKAFQKPPARFNWRQAFVEPFQVRTFVCALMMYLLAFVAMDTVSSVLVYFMKYYLGRGDEANYVSGALLVAQVAVLPLYVALSRRIGKSRGYSLGAALWMVAMLTSLLMAPESPVWVIYGFALLIGLATGGIVVMIYAIFPDIPDVDELQSGERREGIFSALVTFTRKLSSALAIFMVSQVIGLAGYVRPVEQVVGGATKLIEQAQPAGFVLALRLIFVLAPLVLLALALVFAGRYPLTAERHRRLNALLDKRRAGQADSPEMAEEAAELARVLARG